MILFGIITQSIESLFLFQEPDDFIETMINEDVSALEPYF